MWAGVSDYVQAKSDDFFDGAVKNGNRKSEEPNQENSQPEKGRKSTVTTHYNMSRNTALAHSLLSGVVNDRYRRVTRVVQSREQTEILFKANRTTIDGKLYEYRYAEVLTTRTSIEIELYPTGKVKNSTYNSYTIKSHFKVEIDDNGKEILTNPISDPTIFEDPRPVNSSDVDAFLRKKLNDAIRYNARGWKFPTGGPEVGPIIDPFEYSNQAEKTMNSIHE
jgi:hypothetical protein